MATLKKCSKCLLEKDGNNFTKNMKTKDKLSYSCKECISLIYIKNKDKIIKYQEENKEHIQAYQKVYWKNNKEELNKKQRSFYSENKERLNVITRDYYNSHRDELVEYQKQYRAQNPEKIRETHRKNYASNKNNPEYKLRKNCSRSIYDAIKSDGKHGESILQYLPYTMQELKAHLQAQFEPWMSWNNWGKYNKSTWNDNDSATWTWQIDHIIPQSKLLYASMEDDNFNKCWALSNLRPLSAKQNLLDGKRS